jgi:hypothetical protein
LPPKARRLKRAMDSIEAYRTQQLEKLRENYTQQVRKTYFKIRKKY